MPSGSGEVEAQCKTLVQQRCRQAGMRWHRRGLESLLRVRCAVRDGRYDRHFGKWKGDLPLGTRPEPDIIGKSPEPIHPQPTAPADSGFTDSASRGFSCISAANLLSEASTIP